MLERCVGGWRWEEVGKVPLAVADNRLELAIPRRLLGLPVGTSIDLGFKWVDNVQKPGDIMDFYVSGDAAPGGRFNFRYLE